MSPRRHSIVVRVVIGVCVAVLTVIFLRPLADVAVRSMDQLREALVVVAEK